MQDNFKSYANSFQAVARLQLEGIRCLMKHLGNPQNNLKFIHIAGTNGKGSVCSFLQNIFTLSGKKCGKYTSPNLISVCERISIDGTEITEAELDPILDRVKVAAELVEAELSEAPTQFEIWTAAALLYFEQKKCDLVILETGLGGTRDATNVIPPPLAAVITRLDLDHTEYLGDTLSQIATEKAGIIKRGTPLCVTCPQESEAIAVLERTCAGLGVELAIASPPEIKGIEGFREIFDYSSLSGNICDAVCGICGAYQPENAALACEVALKIGVDPQTIAKGLSLATNPARFEVLEKDPIVIYDGAHNKNGMAALCKSLKRYFPDWTGATFIMAFMGDKDYGSAFAELKRAGLDRSSEFFAVKVQDNPRAAEPQDLVAKLSELGFSATAFESLEDAYNLAKTKGKPVIVCGSLYLYKDLYYVRRK